MNEKEKNTWRREILVCGVEEEKRMKRKKIFGEGKYLSSGGEEK